MAFDMDELHKRRQQREQQRQERLRQKKQLTTRLLIAGVVLLLVAGLILAVSLGASGDPDGQTEPSQVLNQQPQNTEPSVQTTVPPVTVVSFTAVGDLNITEKVVSSGGVGYDYTGTFMDVVPVLSQSDLTAVNLEGVLCGAPYGAESRSAPQTMMTALANAGVDLVQVANSYAIKNGVSGLGMTLANIRAAGLESVGAYADEQAYKESGGYTIRNVNGVRIAIVAFTKGMDGMALPASSEKCVNVLYSDYSSTYRQVDTEGITGLLSRVAKEKPDVTIALVHWGSEFNDTHSDSQKQIRDLMLEQGVDAIIGTHPHYVQELEYNADNGTFVAYSLGDFIGDATRSGTEYSIAVHLEITKDNAAGTAKITGYSYTPLFTAAQADGTVRVMRLEPAMAAYESGYIDRVSPDVYAGMGYGLERIRDRITSD